MVRSSAKFAVALVASGALGLSAAAAAQTAPTDIPPPTDAPPPATPPADPLPPPTEPSTDPMPPASNTAPPAGQTVEVGDQEIRSFAVALVELDKIQRQYEPRLEAAGAAERPVIEREANEKMTEVVVEQGLDPQTFNAISMTAQEDPQLQAKIREELAKIDPATPSAQ